MRSFFSSSVVERRVCFIFMYPRVFLRCCRREPRQFKAEIAAAMMTSFLSFSLRITSLRRVLYSRAEFGTCAVSAASAVYTVLVSSA